MHFNKIVFTVIFSFSFLLISCINSRQFKSPAGYDINKPEKYVMTSSLKEISGFTFLNGKEDSTFAIEDEGGKLYYFSLGTDKIAHSKFGKKGDYEDVSIFKNSLVAVLRSEGSILLFPAIQVGKEKIDSVTEYTNILPEGEYEGLFADSSKLYALCKNCTGDKAKKEVSIYTLEQLNGAPLAITSSFKIDISTTQPENEKEKFHPSAIARHPITHDWYIISSVNKMLLILDQSWKVSAYYPLDPSLFKQPEGITFNNKGDLYISNEGGDGDGNILLFKYQHK